MSAERVKAVATADMASSYPLYLAASRMSQRLAHQGGLPEEDASRVYFLTGAIEDALPASHDLPLREFYFERAILIAPHGPSARAAFAALVAVVEARFSPAPVPTEISEHLARLADRLP